MSVVANNIVGSSEETTIYFSKYIYIFVSVLCHISYNEIHSLNIMNSRARPANRTCGVWGRLSKWGSIQFILQTGLITVKISVIIHKKNS